MKKFAYTIQDANGVHARPAGLLVKAAKALDSTITLETAAGKSAVATKLMAVMGLGIKQGDTVTVIVEDSNEEASAAAREKFFSENLYMKERSPSASLGAVGGRLIWDSLPCNVTPTVYNVFRG